MSRKMGISATRRRRGPGAQRCRLGTLETEVIRPTERLAIYARLKRNTPPHRRSSTFDGFDQTFFLWQTGASDDLMNFGKKTSVAQWPKSSNLLA